MKTPQNVSTDMLRICTCVYVRTYACNVMYVCIYVLEMQQYINISPYRDTLGGDTVSIHI